MNTLFIGRIVRVKGILNRFIYKTVAFLNFSTGFGNPEFDCEGRISIAEYFKFIYLNIYFLMDRKTMSV